jgi:cell division protein FtsA
LRTLIPEAEKVKRAWGERDLEKPAGTVLEVPSVGERPARVVSYSMLSEIIEPRAEELLELIQAELERSVSGKQLRTGLVLAGGGAKLGGLAVFAEQKLGLPVRVGVPAGLETLDETLADPALATVAGLVIHGNRLRLLRDARESTGLLDRFLKSMRARED